MTSDGLVFGRIYVVRERFAMWQPNLSGMISDRDRLVGTVEVGTLVVPLMSQRQLWGALYSDHIMVYSIQLSQAGWVYCRPEDGCTRWFRDEWDV